MIEINDVQIHTEWSELTPDETLQVIDLLELLYKEVDVVEFRLRLLAILSGYKRSKKRYSKEEQETINSNLAILADQLRFPIFFQYKETDRLAKASPELQTALKKRLPFEIYEPDLYEEAQRYITLTPILRVDIDWKHNPVPEFEHSGETFLGPVINIDNYGIITTTLTAGEYVDALSHFNAYLETTDESFLKNILAVLYRPKAMNYTDREYTVNRDFLDTTPDRYSKLAFYLMQNISEFLVQKSAYSILFAGGSDASESKKINLGAQSTIYDLVKAGYGTDEEIRETNLMNYLNMQIDKLKSFVAECRAYKLKDTEINRKYHIPMTVLKQL